MKKGKRCFLYNAANRSGQLFTGDEAIEAALENGWQDTPLPVDESAQADSEADGSAGVISELQDQIEFLNDSLNQSELDRKAAVERAEAAEAELTASQSRVTAAEKEVEKLQAAAKAKGGRGAGK